MVIPSAVRRASRWRDSVRLLLLIDAAARAPEEGEGVPESAVGVVHAQVRLQKLDFWVRYLTIWPSSLTDTPPQTISPSGCRAEHCFGPA